MNIIEKIINQCTRKILKYNDSEKMTKKYLELLYRRMNMDSRVDIDNPKTYVDKLNWLKIYNHNPQYTLMADKFRVKKYVEEKMGSSELVIPVIASWRNPDEIDITTLPDKFVIKANHDCGSVYICTEKNKFDIEGVKKALKKSLKKNYYWGGREWVYKNIEKCIFAEEYVENLSDNNYKFFCFNGVAKMVYVAPFRESSVDYFDMDYKHLDIHTRLHGPADTVPAKPSRFDEMIRIAERLSEGIPHVRIDLYEADGKIYFGECTFYHEAGFVPFIPDKWNKIFGDWIDISSIKTK